VPLQNPTVLSYDYNVLSYSLYICARKLRLVPDSITSTSCGYVVQQVVRLVVRLAVCSTTCCGLAVGFRFIVDLSYSLLCNISTTNLN